jgi:hypothetical protein
MPSGEGFGAAKLEAAADDHMTMIGNPSTEFASTSNTQGLSMPHRDFEGAGSIRGET